MEDLEKLQDMLANLLVDANDNLGSEKVQPYI